MSSTLTSCTNDALSSYWNIPYHKLQLLHRPWLTSHVLSFLRFHLSILETCFTLKPKFSVYIVPLSASLLSIFNPFLPFLSRCYLCLDQLDHKDCPFCILLVSSSKDARTLLLSLLLGVVCRKPILSTSFSSLLASPSCFTNTWILEWLGPLRLSFC